MDIYFYLIIILFLITGNCVIYWLLVKIRRLSRKSSVLEKAFNQVTPICITNIGHEIVMANDAYWTIFGEPNNKKQPINCFEHRSGEACHTEKCPLTQILNGQEEYISEPQKVNEGNISYFIITARPFYGRNHEILGIIESFQDITAKKKLEYEKEELINRLEESLGKSKLLSGFMPICTSCKKIRDDKGYWNQIESYIKAYSESELIHSLCPECTKKLDTEYVQESPNK